jgi:hypothetical protein
MHNVSYPKSTALPTGEMTDQERVYVNNMLQGIHIFRAFDVVEQLSTLKALPQFITAHNRQAITGQDGDTKSSSASSFSAGPLSASTHQVQPIRLLIMDSVAFHFRRGFKDMSQRSRMLLSMAQDLMMLAKSFGLTVCLISHSTYLMCICLYYDKILTSMCLILLKSVK